MKKRITFFTGGEDVFIRDIIIGLRGKYDVQFCQRPNEQEFYQKYHNTDIAWFEWCDGLFIEAMKGPKVCKVINRLHSFEFFTDMPQQIDWNKVDKLVLVSDTMKNMVLGKFGIRPDIATVIHNGVDVDRYIVPEDKKYNRRIAFIGYLNYKKAPELLLHFWNSVYKYDNRFEFHIAGDFQDERIFLYFNSVAPNLPFKINFDGWVSDIPTYLKDKDYVISTSLFESFQYSLAEGMAQGVVPLIHGWHGSSELYPKKYIFYTADDLIGNIINFEKSKMHEERKNLHQFIVDNYSLKSQIEKVENLIEGM